MVRIRRGLELVKFRVVDESGSVDITFFNQPYIKNNIHRGDCLNIYGKIIGVGGKRTMTNPVIEREGYGRRSHGAHSSGVQAHDGSFAEAYYIRRASGA